MYAKDVAHLLHKRIFKGGRPLALLLVGVLLCGIHLLTAPLGLSLPLTLVTLAFPFALLGIGPIPWQWTGSDAPKADFLPGLLQALVIGGIWVGLVMFAIYVLRPSRGFPMPPAPGSMVDPSLGPFGFALVVALGFGWLLAEKEDTEGQKRSTEELLHEVQRRALQSQMEPHVLYNALNSLAGLIQEDQDLAEEVVVRIADLYRMLAKQGEATQIPLRDERRLVEAYLSMEEMRLGERLETLWAWTDSAEEGMVPPLILQPLVENAIKHGISPTGKGGKLLITHQRHGETHLLQVANTGHAPEADAPRGVGLGNLEARLALWPDTKATLEFLRQGEWTLATVRWTPQEAR